MDHALSTRRVPLASIHPDPANVRSHPQASLEAIKASLARFGQQKPIVVDRNGTIRAGNGTYAAAKALGWPEIHVVETDLEGVEAVAYAIADNRTTDLSSFEDEALAKLLVELREAEALEGSGFDDEDVDRLLMELGQDPADVEQDEAPALPEEAVTQPGDLWVLGRHRLLCGDSAKDEDVDRLLAGAPVHLVHTDPPYGVGIQRGANNAAEGWRSTGEGLQNDDLSPEDYERALAAWFASLSRVLMPGRAFYLWGGYANLDNYVRALQATELRFSQVLVWDKEHPVLTRKDFMACFELCFYGWREGAAHEFLGPANAQDLWHVKKVNPRAMVHLTEKPVELAARALQYSSRRGENVLDLFGGSGSTLVACEQAERTAYLMEIDPRYCDVIVQRWEALTGEKAERDS